MYIKDDEINKYFNEINWKVAHNVFQHNGICNMSVIQIENTYQVVGTIDINGKQNTAKIIIDKSGNIIEFNCDCNDVKANELACGHIGALLLKFYGLEMSDIPYSFNQQPNYLDKLQELEAKKEADYLIEQQGITKDLIKHYRINSKVNENTLSPAVHLYPNVRVTFDRLFVSYKIGNDKTYSIKSLPDLVNDYIRKNIVTYGKSFTTNHNLDCFDPSSRRQISFIREHQKDMDDSKSIRITKDNIDAFFLSHYSNLDININFTTIDLNNFVFELTKDEDYTQIKLKSMDGIVIIGNEYIYYFDHCTLNRYSKECSDKLRPLLCRLINGPLMVSNLDLGLFSKYILDQVITYVSIEGDTIDEYLPSDVLLLIYVDINNNNELTVNLDFKDDQGQTIIDDLDTMVLPLRLDEVIDTLNQYLEYDEITNMYYLSNDEDIYFFITAILPQLNDVCEIYVSEEIKQFNKPKNLSLSIGIHLKNNLLEIDLDSINVDKNEIRDILLAYQNKKVYHRLKNGEFINLNDDTIKEITNLIQDLNLKEENIKDGVIEVDKYHSLYLNNLVDNNNSISISRDDSFNELISTIEHPDVNSFEVPNHYQDILRDYQVTGFKWLKTMSEYGFGGILADDMGLGKTLQMITLLDDVKKENIPNIVIAPATLIYNWEDEIHKFSTDLKTICVTGTLPNRKKQISMINDYDVVITSYDYIRRDFELYSYISFNYIILDEAQYIKNQSTKNAQSVKAIQGRYRFALTGTPIENSLAELWSIFDFLMPNYLYNYHYFKEHFEAPIIRDEDYEKQIKLKQMVEPFILRRTKKDVLDELPDKIENNIAINFSSEEEKVYLANLSQINSDLQSAIQVDHIDKIQILAMMTRLRQLCCDQRILYDNIKEPSSKMHACLDIIRNAKENGQKVLLFSSFTSSLDLIEAELNKEDISYYVLTGATNKIKRHQLVNAFQKDNTTVFLISLKAGGTGLNLTSASVVIHYDPWWNMSAQNQATDRAYRIGQTNNVQVYKLIMRNSIEERIQHLQEQKQDLSDLFVENNNGSITKMSTNEIIDLFK